MTTTFPPLSLFREGMHLPSKHCCMDGGGAQTPSLSSPLKKDEKTAPATFMRRDLYFFSPGVFFYAFPYFLSGAITETSEGRKGERRKRA